MPKVYNRHHGDAPPDAVYIGRGTIWGNPFIIGEDGDRDNVIQLYRKRIFFKEGFEEKIQAELKGKDLVCYCAPLPCHGDVLLEIANED